LHRGGALVFTSEQINLMLKKVMNQMETSMFTPEQITLIMNKALAQLGINEDADNKCNKNTTIKSCGKKNEKKINLTPSQIIVIAAIIGGVLQVDLVSIDKDQDVQVVLVGSLKEKTQLEKIMDQVGSMPFDEVVKAIIGRLQ